MKLSVVDTSGQKVSSIAVSDAIFAQPMNEALVAQAIYVYRMNQRQGSARVLSRGEVYGSRRKLWRQKGTGRARHGDRFAPQFVGGGVAHGPTGKENWSRQLNEKMRRKALFCVLSQKQLQRQLTVVDSLGKLEKTKRVAEALGRLGIGKRTLLVVKDPPEMLARAVRNLHQVAFLPAHSLNALEVLKADRLIITREAIEVVQSTFL